MMLSNVAVRAKEQTPPSAFALCAALTGHRRRRLFEIFATTGVDRRISDRLYAGHRRRRWRRGGL